jgi:hypothetical protein
MLSTALITCYRRIGSLLINEMNRICKELSEVLFAILLQNMLGEIEDNYVNCLEPRYKLRTSVISIRRVTLGIYKRTKLIHKLLKFVF